MSARARAVRHVPIGRYRRAPVHAEGHRIRWFVWAGNEKLPHTSSMRGNWGYDAECSCGWESGVGGGTKRYVTEKIREHMEEAARPIGATISAGSTTFRWNGSEWEHMRDAPGQYRRNAKHRHVWAVGSDRCQSPGCYATTAPRGPLTFLSAKAKPGTRVRHTMSGATGTFVGLSRGNSTGRTFGAIVDWDDRGFGVVRGRVVAPDWDLEEIK